MTQYLLIVFGILLASILTFGCVDSDVHYLRIGPPDSTLDVYINAINDRDEIIVKNLLSSDLKFQFDEEFTRTKQDPVELALHDLDVKGAKIENYDYKILHESRDHAWVEVNITWFYVNNSHMHELKNLKFSREGNEWKLSNFFPFYDPENFTINLSE